jgi:hypothetical protein
MREVVLIFQLQEDVTPALFAEKIAFACAKGGAIRPGEIVRTQDGNAFIYSGLQDLGDLLGETTRGTMSPKIERWLT